VTGFGGLSEKIKNILTLMNVFEIGVRTRTEEEAYIYAKELGLVRSSPQPCYNYGRQMNVERGKIRHVIDGRYRCGVKGCRNSESLFAHTIFYRTHISISKCIRALYLNSLNLKTSKIAQEISTTRETISSFFLKL
jgi:hypothetical protein